MEKSLKILFPSAFLIMRNHEIFLKVDETGNGGLN